MTSIVTVTGAAGQIGYSILPMIANGDMAIGSITLRLLDIPQAKDVLEGVKLELLDMNSTVVESVEVHTDNHTAFEDVDYAILIGGRPQKQGEPRSELLKDNVNIIVNQAKEIRNPHAKVLVVANPANTLAYFANKNTPAEVSALSRLDHNRAVSMMRQRHGEPSMYDGDVAVMGNHSDDMIPLGVDADMIEEIKTRAAHVQRLRGRSSALSAAKASVDHMRDWINGIQWHETVSMAVPAPADNTYGVPEGMVFSFPMNTTPHEQHIKENFNPNPEEILKNIKALQSEIDTVEKS